MTKQHDQEFKTDALNYRKLHPELTVDEVCKNLGISSASYYKWLKEAGANDGVITVRGSGNYASDEAKEIARLQRELKAKDEALRILKKAIGILGEEQK
jgi:transposase